MELLFTFRALFRIEQKKLINNCFFFHDDSCIIIIIISVLYGNKFELSRILAQCALHRTTSESCAPPLWLHRYVLCLHLPGVNYLLIASQRKSNKVCNGPSDFRFRAFLVV